MALAVDSSTPATSSFAGTPTSPLTSNSFTPPANSLVVVGISGAAQGSGTMVTATGVSDGTSTYSQLTSASQSSQVFAGLWCFYYTSSPGAITVRAVLNAAPTQGASLTPVVWTGAASTQNGAVATPQSAASGATPSVSLTTTATGSQVVGQECNFTSATSPTAASGQTITFNANSSFVTQSGNGYWAQALSSPAGAPGSVTLSDTAPTGLEIVFVAAEILAAAASASGPIFTPHRMPLGA